MRIATSTMTSLATSSMGNSYDKYMDIINKITSNKNFTKVSENPIDATKVLKLNDQLAKLDEYQSNIQAAINEMSLAYDTLGAVNDELTSINDLVIEAANISTTPQGARAIAVEMSQRIESIIDKMNTKYLDNYIFSGVYTEKAAYTVTSDGTVEYHGSSEKAGDRNLTISQDKTFAYNFTGEEIFGKFDPDNVDENDVPLDFFSQMQDLQTILKTEPLDYDAIRNKLDVLKEAQEAIIQTQGTTSAKVAKLLSTQEINNSTITDLTENKVDLEEVDITKAATDLANAQNALQASYLISTNILGSVSLLDYL